MSGARQEREERVSELLARMTLREQLAMMDGDLPFYSGLLSLARDDYYHRLPFPAGRNERLGIEGVQFVDGPRGIVLYGGATCFPVSMARGATFDPDLEERIGDAIGKELRSHGGNLFGGVCINLLRHPAWGRAQETYGEDPLHLGAMGAALVRGVERHGMACVKHFAANSMENARFQVDVSIAPRPLHEIYLPHFKACIDAGASVVMSAYNSVNGAWCGQNRELLTEVLRDRWAFDGFVLTDFVFGVRDAEEGVMAGQDLEMPFRFVFRQALERLVRDGRVPRERIATSVRRILRKLLALPPASDYPATLRACSAHVSLAREAARKSIVMLRNEDAVLPVAEDKTVALIGRLAATPNLGDRGSSDGRPPYAVTPLEGFRGIWGDRVEHDEGHDLRRASEVARRSDVAVVVVGYTHREEGELIAPPDIGPFVELFPPPKPLKGRLRPLWSSMSQWVSRMVLDRTKKELADDRVSFGAGGDRSSLRLPEADVALIRAVAAANAATVVVVMAGSAVITTEWEHLARGLLILWYPGMEGGHALAELVSGRVCPSGRLPFAVPSDESHLPSFDMDATAVTYDLWHGYRKLARDGVAPAYPFGFGMSYARFAHGPPSLASSRVGADDTVTLTVEIRNEGDVSGDEVVQVYARREDSVVDRADRWLVAFERIAVDAAKTRTVDVVIPVQRLAYFDETRDDFVVEPGRYELIVARDERDAGQSLSLTVD